MDDVQCGNVEQFVFIVYVGFFQYFGGDSYGGIYWVGDNVDVGLWVGFGNLLYEVFYDICIYIKQVGMIYVGFMCYVCGDQYYICVFQCWSSVFIGKFFNFYICGDMIQIYCYVWCNWSDVV